MFNFKKIEKFIQWNSSQDDLDADPQVTVCLDQMILFNVSLSASLVELFY